MSPSLYSGQIKPLPLWRTHLSARMAIGRELLVIFAVGTLGLVQGFGLGPSLEWKDGDAELWAQVCIIFYALHKLKTILFLTFRCQRLQHSSQVRRHQRYFFVRYKWVMTHSLVGRHDNPTLKYNVSMFLPVKVFVEWPSNIRVDLNDSVGVGRMQVRAKSTNFISPKFHTKLS